MTKLITAATLVCALVTPIGALAQCPSLFLSQGPIQIGAGVASSGSSGHEVDASLSVRFLRGTLASVSVQQSRIAGIDANRRGASLTLAREFGLGAFSICPSAGIRSRGLASESSTATGTISTRTVPLAMAVGRRFALGRSASVTAVVEGIVDARQESSRSLAPDGWLISWHDQEVATGAGVGLTFRAGRAGIAARYSTALGSDAQAVSLALLIGTR
jgi:hypothetical protein